MITTVLQEIRNTLKRPARLGGLFNTERLRRYFTSLRLRLRYDTAWSSAADGGLTRREYRTYGDYIAHQQSKMKFGLIDLNSHDVKYREILRKRLMAQPVDWAGKKVLCLAARIGTEVKSFLDLGCFAVGTDIGPGPENKYVVYGDFHDIQFASHSIDVIFTNALDHAFDIDRVLAESRRVLGEQGMLILEVVRGSAEGVEPMFYESVAWARADDLIPIVERHGFRLLKSDPFDDYTYPGVQFYFVTR